MRRDTPFSWTEVEEAEKRTKASDSSLKALRASSVKEVERLKKSEQDAFFDQREAIQGQPAIKDAVDSSWVNPWVCHR